MLGMSAFFLAALALAPAIAGEQEIHPRFSGYGFDYMHVGGSTVGTGGIVQDRANYTPHVEGAASSTYLSICVDVATANASGKVSLALLSNAPGFDLPEDTLWFSQPISTATSGSKCVQFRDTLAGTWTLAGAAFKDSNGDLLLSAGDVVWRAVGVDDTAAVTLVVVSPTARRSLGSPVADQNDLQLSGARYDFSSGVVDFSGQTGMSGSVTPLTSSPPEILLVH